MIEHLFTEVPVHVFADGGVFAITAGIRLTRTQIAWRVPRCLKAALQTKVQKLEPDALDDTSILAGHSRWLEQVLGAPDGSVSWELAVAYDYPMQSVELISHEPAVFNKDFHSNSERLEGAYPEKRVQRFRDMPFYAGVFDGQAIVSECFHDGNGAVTVHTDQAYRGRGYASSCLRVVTDRTLKAKIRPGYGTSFGNGAARAVAERCGYVLAELMYWVGIAKESYAKIPPEMRESLER
jgi:RimJ/RimL family protein N-acetyltransferase